MVRKLLAGMLFMVVSCFSAWGNPQGEGNVEGKKESIKMLFYGNSFTKMWDIPFLVQQMAENGQPGLTVDSITVSAGGSNGELQPHWERGGQCYLELPDLSTEELESACAEMEQAEKTDRGLFNRGKRYQKWLQWKKDSGKTPKFDYVVLQAWKRGSYPDYIRKFVEIARKYGTKPILYFPEPVLNAEPLDKPPDLEPVMEKARLAAELGNELDALVVPVGLAIFKVHEKRPDLPMRFVEDFHLNQICAYLTTCCFYAAMFDESPVGLTIRGINIPRHDTWRKYDPDGNPYNVEFPEELATLLQKSAWDAVQEMKNLQKELAENSN